MRAGPGLAFCAIALLAACNDDDNPVPGPPPAPAPAPATYTVGGTVSGLSGSVTLANNGGDARTVSASGAFTFATPVAGGGAYAVTVTTQPATQVCTVGMGSGTVASANVGSVTVTCVTKIHTVGGSVTGLAGSGLVLQNNAGDNLARTADGAFTFATPVDSGTAYNVTVFAQPANPAQTCTPTDNTGTATANVLNVAITCVTNTLTPGMAVIGPAGGTVNGAYGAQIIVPPGALATAVTIGLARDSSNSPDLAVADVDAVGATYELTPHGQAFTLPVTVRIPFDPAQVANDSTPALYKAEVAGTFASLATTVNGNFLETTVTNFSWVMPASQATRPRMVYAVENAAGALSIASYRIDRASGALGAPTSSAAVGDFPTSAVAHPSGRFLFVTNAGGATVNGIDANSVSTYGLSTINGQIGGLGSTTVTRAPMGYRPTMPVVHPNGKFLYVMNFGNAANGGGGDIDVFAIDGAKGALTLSGNAITGDGAQPMGIAFNRLGTRAYVLYSGSLSNNPLSTQVALYNVNLTSGAFSGPVSSAAAGVLGSNPWSIAIDPNGKALYVGCVSTNELLSFGINAATGALSSLGSIQVRDKAASVAVDSFGRFAFVAKQQPFFTVNALSFLMDASTGTLSAAGSAMSGCPGGACTGPISLIAEPQGDFTYAIDSVGGLTSFAVNQTTGALTNVASRSGVWVPTPGGVGFPFTFAASGTSPVWQSNCTNGCVMTGDVFRSGGGGGGNPPSNPTPPTSHYLSVAQGAYFGLVTSSPAGIDYGPATNGNPLGSNISANHFSANSSVQLCASPPPDAGGPYDITWTGSCSGTGQCTSVHMNSDKFCNLTFSPASTRFP